MYHIWETNDVIQMREKWEGMIDGIFDLLWLYSDDKGPYSQGCDLSSSHVRI